MESYICFCPSITFYCSISDSKPIIMVNVPKMRRTYCPHPDCMSHKQFKVVQYKKSAESKQAQGRRR